MIAVTYTFQDASGNPIANGKATFRLNTDAVVTASGQQINAGIVTSFALDNSGTLSGNIWPNDQLTPTNTVYKASVFTSQGQLVWNEDLSIISTDFGSFVLLESGDFVLLESGDFVLLE